MSVEITETNGCRKTLKITVPAENVQKEFDAAVDMYKKQAAIPGFRKGKATKKVIIKKFGADILKDIEQRVVSEAYHSAIESEEIKVAMVVNVTDVKCTVEDGAEFKAIVDVEPEFKMPKYEKLNLKPKVEKIKDEEVEETFNSYVASRASYEKVEDRPAEKEDFTRVSFEGTLDGQALTELGDAVKRVSSRDNFWVFPEFNDVIPGLDEAIIGMSVNETKDIKVKFPKDYAIKEVAGKTVDYKVTLEEIQKRVLPEINEEFLKLFDVETVDELKDKIKDDIKARNENQDKNRMLQEVADYLDKHTKMELPESLVAMETRQRLQQAVGQLMQQGQTEEDIKKNQEDILKKCEEEAKKAVKLSFILLDIATEKAIDVSDEEVQNTISYYAMQRQMSADQYLEKVLNNNTENIKENIICNKALEAVRDEILAK